MKDNILDTKLEFGKDADGCDIVTCPFCGRWQWALIADGDNDAGLDVFDHKENCAYLIAKKEIEKDMESDRLREKLKC